MDNLKKQISSILQKAGIGNFNQEARWIAEESPSPQSALERAGRRAGGEPLQYLLGTAPFRNLMLKVDRRVLIPRPETELLVQWIIDCAPANGSVLDLGCGSGAIAIATATERPDLTVCAVDISNDALDVARSNAADYPGNKIEFIRSDLFSALTGRSFDVIGANLPYVTDDEYPELDAEVRDFEPRLALTAPEDGLQLIRMTIEQLSFHLNPGGRAIFELSPHQAKRTVQLLEANGFSAGIICDLCQRERFVTGVKK